MNTTRTLTGPARAALAVLAGLVLSAAPLATAPAHAQVLGAAPYVPAPDPAVEALRRRLDTLEADIKRATSRTEQLAYDLTQARRLAEEANTGRIQAEKALELMTRRVEALETLASGGAGDQAAMMSRLPASATVSLLPGGSGAVNGPTAPAESSASLVDVSKLPQDETGLMREARNLLLEGRYVSAESAFAHYLKTHAKSSSAHEAQYMLGEAQLYQGEYAAAADSYGKLLSAHPNSSYGPMGLVKLSRSLRLLDKKPDACKALGLMSSRFPKAPAEAKELAATERQRASC